MAHKFYFIKFLIIFSYFNVVYAQNTPVTLQDFFNGKTLQYIKDKNIVGTETITIDVPKPSQSILRLRESFISNGA